MASFEDPGLQALQQRLKPETWERRLAEAARQAAEVEAVEAARAAGESETAALVGLIPGLHRSTYLGRRRRYRAGGVAALVDRHVGRAPIVTPEIRQVICALRHADPHIAVERIAGVVAARLDVLLSTTTIKRVLRQAGLNRPPGGGPRRPAEGEELQLAGSIFLQLADEELGLSLELAKTISLAAKAAPAPEPAAEREPVRKGRDANGCFTAAYNQGQAKGEEDLGPAFRSVTEKRQAVDLRERRVAKEEVATLQRKVKALIALPLLTDSGKVLQLDDYRGGYGVAEFAGVQYSADTLDRFLRDLKYAGISPQLTAWHAAFWVGYETATHGGEEPPAAICCYVDGVGKALYTQHFTKAGRVSSTGRVMSCLDQVLVHTGFGTPIFWQSFSGHASLVTQTLPLLDRLEAAVGEDWWVDRMVVLDGEGDAVGLFKQCDQRKPKPRYFVTMLGEGRVKSLADVEELGEWQPFREHQEVANGFIWLVDSKEPKTAPPYRLRVVVIRRRGGNKLSALGTNAPAERYEPLAIATGYFQRWPLQELRFRTVNQATKFKRLAGYGKLRVQNITVLSELDDRKVQRDRVAKRIDKLREQLGTDRQALQKAKLRLNAAKARRARQDDLVVAELEARRLDRQTLQDRIETTQQERERFTAAEAEIRTREKVVAETQAKLDRALVELPRVEERIAELEDRKEIYQADTELDQLMTLFKLCFVLLGEHVLRSYFAGLRISLYGFMRQILSLPGTRTIERGVEHVRIKASPNREMMAALVAACDRVNALGIRRNRRLVRLSVVPSEHAHRKRSNPT